MKILFIVGSLRKDSLNAKLAHNLARIIGEVDADNKIEYADVNLPLFNSDNYDHPDQLVIALRDQIEATDLVFIVSPEYNHSISGVLKNALDWTSWSSHNSWAGKKVVMAGASPSSLGTALAQVDTRKVLTFINANVFLRPEFYLSFAPRMFDANGDLVADEVNFATTFIKATLDFANK